MTSQHIIIIGGGLAGLSAGSYARASGFTTTIVEHNLALGGVCTAWSRGPYTIDGCIDWLTGGAFDRIYTELGIFPGLGRHTLDHFATYRDLRTGTDIKLDRDLGALSQRLTQLAPEDAAQLRHFFDAIDSVSAMPMDIETAPELVPLSESMGRFWQMRKQLPAIIHYQKSIWAFCEELESPLLRRFFGSLWPENGSSTLFLLFMLAFLRQGSLSRPKGGSAAFRDALVRTYHELGGESSLHTTVEEILVDDDRARGVRLADGTLLHGDAVISTASGPETVLRLLGGRYGAAQMRKQLEQHPLFSPIVLASYGVADPLTNQPSTLILDGIAPLNAAGRVYDSLRLRIFNDEPSVAPIGHTVVQAMLPSDYDWWATRGVRYGAEKAQMADAVLRQIEAYVPGMKGATTERDIATPLTYWHAARSWRGAFEGWVPAPGTWPGHMHQTLPGLRRFLMAGQWVEPGGGVPAALMSGRNAVQLLCRDLDRHFATPIFVAG